MDANSNKRTILIIGSSGNLGNSISNYLENTLNVYKTYFSNPVDDGYFLDVLDINSIKSVLNDTNPDYVINCCAYTDVDTSEINHMLSHNLNVSSVQNILKAIDSDTKLIHLSTDYVFDGKKSNYSELDIPNPINYYGKTKHEAENIIRGSNRKYIIFRLSVPYEYSTNSNNFFMWVYNNIIKENPIEVVDDQISNPTYIPAFSEVLFKSIIMDLNGIFHYGSSDSISRYEFSVIISKVFGCDISLIKRVRSSDLFQRAARPINSTLDTSKIQDALNLETYETKYCIKNIIQEYNLDG